MQVDEYMVNLLEYQTTAISTVFKAS